MGSMPGHVLLHSGPQNPTLHTHLPSPAEEIRSTSRTMADKYICEDKSKYVNTSQQGAK